MTVVRHEGAPISAAGGRRVRQSVSASQACAAPSSVDSSKGARDQLHADGQALGEAARDADRGIAGDIDGDREQVVEVHRERIAELRAEREGDRRRGRREQQVVLREGGLELRADQRPHLLRLAVVGVVVARGERVRADHDAALYLVAKAVTAGPFHLVPHAFAALEAITVLDTVVAGEVRRGFGGRDDVVGGKRDLQRGQRDRAIDDRALPLEERDGLLERLSHAVLEACSEHLAGDADAQAFEATIEALAVVGHGFGRGGRVARIVPGDRLQQRGRVARIAGEGPDLLQRGSEGDDAVAADAAVGGLEPDDAGERGRLPDRAARVRAEGDRHASRRHGGRRPAGGTAGHAREIPRVARRAVARVLRRGSHRELVEVRLADEDGALFAQPRDDRAVDDRREALEDPRARGGLDAARGEHVLERDGDAGQRRSLARAQPLVGGVRLGEGFLGRDADVGVEIGLLRAHARERRLGQGARAVLARAQRGGVLVRAAIEVDRRSAGWRGAGQRRVSHRAPGRAPHGRGCSHLRGRVSWRAPRRRSPMAGDRRTARR